MCPQASKPAAPALQGSADPPYLHPPYVSTRSRAPTAPLVSLGDRSALSERSGPRFEGVRLPEMAGDLTTGHGGPPLGERIVVAGRILDDRGRPVPTVLVEVWQCNAAGRYLHVRDQHDAPLDPHFVGAGQVITDAEGRYRFKTIRPGSYPWRNHDNAWRPPHIHFSVFGAGMANRLVTQMYFPADPLLEFDPIFNSVPDPAARARMVSAFDWELTEPEHALGYRFDIVLRGRDETPREGSR